MPTNEILAKSYLKVFYRNPDVDHQHSLRLYFDAVPTDSGGSVFVFTGYTDASHLTGWSVADIVAEFIARQAVSNGNLPAYSIDKVEVWQGDTVGPNIFLGYDGGDYTGVVGGGAAPNAAAYSMWVFEGAAKVQWRVSFFENHEASPQRFGLTQPPPTDDLSFTWFVLKSAVKFVNQDNIALTLAVSANDGYNRKLARNYGKSIAP